MTSRYVIAALALLLWSVPAMAQTASFSSNVDMIMEKVKADKKRLVASNMDLTDAEAKAFWPLYDGYQQELAQINERLATTIKSYADAFNKGRISNDMAKKLMGETLSLESSEVKLRRTYADKIGKVLPASKTARYIQIENKIRAILKAELAQQIPLVY